MARFSACALLCVALACMVMFTPATEAMQCSDVIKYLLPCVRYLTGKGGPVPSACCEGVRGLNEAASATPDRRTACGCIKQYATGVSGLNGQLVGSLPGTCGVHLPFVPSPSTDCSRVS